MSPFPSNPGRKGLLPKNPSTSISSDVFEPYKTCSTSQIQHNEQIHNEFSPYNNTRMLTNPSNPGRNFLLQTNPSTSISSKEFEPYRSSQIQHIEKMRDEFSPYNITTKEHILTKNAGHKYRSCVYCTHNNVKTKSGWYVNTYYCCEACKVPLCSGERNGRGCFDLYHQETLGMPPAIMNRRGQKVYTD